MRHRGGVDEMLLEARLDGGLDLVDAPTVAPRSGAGGDVAERHARPGPGGVAGAEVTLSSGQSGIMPSTIACFG
jgi:hypothetical protein